MNMKKKIISFLLALVLANCSMSAMAIETRSYNDPECGTHSGLKCNTKNNVIEKWAYSSRSGTYIKKSSSNSKWGASCIAGVNHEQGDTRITMSKFYLYTREAKNRVTHIQAEDLISLAPEREYEYLENQSVVGRTYKLVCTGPAPGWYHYIVLP